MGIRIDPTLEFVWRDPATVQLGVDPPLAVVPVPTTAEERFVCALRRETGREALGALAAGLRCPPEVAADVLAAAAPAVVEVIPRPAPRVQVHGTGSVADSVAAQLAGEGVTVVRTTTGSGTAPDVTTTSSSRPSGAGPAGARRESGAGTRRGSGAGTRRGSGAERDPAPAPGAGTDLDPGTGTGTPLAFAVAVADHVLDPALRAAWTRRDVPHVAVLVGDGTVRVGPVVSAGDGPCLQCVEYARTDDDPAWPAIAAQLWGRPAAALGPWRTAAVAVAVVRIVLEHLPGSTAVHPGSVRRRGDGPGHEQVCFARADLSVTRQPVQPHPRCACRGLPGNDSAPGSPHASTPAATTSRSPTDAHG